MKSYIYSVIITVFLASLVSAISPGGTGAGIKKSVSFIMALVFTVTLARPMISFAEALRDYKFSAFSDGITSDAEKYEDVFRKTAAGITEKEVKKEITRVLLSEFGISEEDQDVRVTITEDLSLPLIEIDLFSGAILKNPRKVEERIGALFDTECKVYENWGDKNG